MIVWGGDGGQGYVRNGAAFRPGSGRWHALPPSPFQARGEPSAVWTGSELLVFGGVSNLVLGHEAAAYSPDKHRWRLLPPSPFGLSGDIASVWTARCAVVSNRTRAAAYASTRNRWIAFPAPPLKRRAETSIIWTGRELIAWGGERLVSGKPYAIERGWRRIPPEPLLPLRART